MQRSVDLIPLLPKLCPGSATLRKAQAWACRGGRGRPVSSPGAWGRISAFILRLVLLPWSDWLWILFSDCGEGRWGEPEVGEFVRRLSGSVGVVKGGASVLDAGLGRNCHSIPVPRAPAVRPHLPAGMALGSETHTARRASFPLCRRAASHPRRGAGGPLLGRFENWPHSASGSRPIWTSSRQPLRVRKESVRLALTRAVVAFTLPGGAPSVPLTHPGPYYF